MLHAVQSRSRSRCKLGLFAVDCKEFHTAVIMKSLASTNCTAFLIVGSLLSFIFCVTLNAVLNTPGISPFNYTIGEISKKYETGITPSPATFSIWGLIYFWQGVLVIYCMTLLCRKAADIPLFVYPAFIPFGFFIFYNLNLISNPGWIVVFLEERNKIAFGLLVFGVASLAFCLFASCAQLESCGAAMEKLGLQADIWCTRIIVQNGVALYLAWVSCATVINGVVVAHYEAGISMSNSCYGALIALNIVVVGWFVLETFLCDRALRYVFAHYITYLAAFSGIYVKNFNPNVPYQIYALVLLILVALFALVKLIVIIVRSVKDPIHYPVSDEKMKFNELESVEIETVRR